MCWPKTKWKRKSNVTELRGKGDRVQDHDYEETGCQASFYWLLPCIEWLACLFPFRMPFYGWLVFETFALCSWKGVRLRCVLLWALLLSRQQPGNVLGTPVGKLSNTYFWAGWKGCRTLRKLTVSVVGLVWEPFQKLDATDTLLILTMLPGTLCHVGSLETILASSKQELAASRLFLLSLWSVFCQPRWINLLCPHVHDTQ